MPRARCRRCAMTVNAAVATSPMKTRPSTEMMRTIVAGERTESSGMGVLTVALFGMTSPAAEAAAESRDSPRKIRTWFGLASWPGATRANSSSRLDGSSTMPVTVKVRPASAPDPAGTCQVEPTRRP